VLSHKTIEHLFSHNLTYQYRAVSVSSFLVLLVLTKPSFFIARRARNHDNFCSTYRHKEATATAVPTVINPKVCEMAPSPIVVLVGDPPGGFGKGAIVGTQAKSVRLALSPTGSYSDSGHSASESVE
jgi:hypothetical protein